jgi:uncharacterized OB-fold protein
MTVTQQRAIEGWFTVGDRPALVGRRCTGCGTFAFPPTVTSCPNPGCPGTDLATVELSRTGHVWSYTDARYQPPPPYVPRSEVYEPFAIAAVELAAERLVVLGQVADGYGVADLALGDEVELVVEPLETVDGVDHLIWRWRPSGSGRR